MTARVAIRDLIGRFVPWWLSDRHLKSPGKDRGYRFLYSVIAPLDNYLEGLVEGLQAAWPGLGTPEALPLIGRSRGILRGQADTDDEYAAKERLWIDKWLGAGSARQLAIELHEYLGNAPRVRIVNRAGHMVTVAADGSISSAIVAWDWDSITNPERANYWSEIWIIIYPTQWAVGGRWGDGSAWGEDADLGFGHDVTSAEADAVRGLLATWKSAHTKVRAVIWCSDSSLFDPSNPTSMPNGKWGQWSMPETDPRVPSDRNLTACRYWEP